MHTLDALEKQIQSELPRIHTELHDGHIAITFRNGETAQVHTSTDKYILEFTKLLGNTAHLEFTKYENLIYELGTLNWPRAPFRYEEPLRAFFAELDKRMQAMGWEFVGHDQLDGSIADWMPKGFDEVELNLSLIHI